MKKITLSALLVVTIAGLAGCNSEEAKSADYYYKHQSEMNKKVDWCYDHTDQESSPNCQSAEAAHKKVMHEFTGY